MCHFFFKATRSDAQWDASDRTSRHLSVPEYWSSAWHQHHAGYSFVRRTPDGYPSLTQFKIKTSWAVLFEVRLRLFRTRNWTPISACIFSLLHHSPYISYGTGWENLLYNLPSSYTAFSQAFTVNLFRWLIRDQRPGKASPFRSDHVNRNGSTATKYRGLGTRQLYNNKFCLCWSFPFPSSPIVGRN